ncbi:insulin-like growth factor-binding protein 3 [Polyodon spathula]|uniref:insulin-like growth factor-binding protein 3 n=1 Tax=Polyodon spathula TaxID=7913 RepID=UPI001B7DFD4B|nr:insulin-like growth factor-binding protein 3 [Polyodon spathula]
MVSRLCVFCLATVLALLSRLAEAVGPVVQCEPCDALALEQCKPLPSECAEKVREPGCGCCLTCALTEGNPCGVYTERCGSGLTCQHQPGETKIMQALLEGRGVCSSGTLNKLRNILLETHSSGNASDSEEERNTSNTDLQGIHSTHRSTESKTLAHPTKADLIRKDLTKKKQRWKVEHPSEPIIHMDTHNFSSESKQETEYGPCRIEMETILNNLKIMNILSPRGVRIPNCDKKGFYKKKQCRPSKGRKRGYCWCVDKYGHTLPGYDGKVKGEAHCYNLEKK